MNAGRYVIWARQLVGGMCVVSMALGASPAIVRADEPDSAALKADVKMLKDRLNKLEQQLASAEMKGVSTTGEKSGLPTLQLPSGLQGLAVSGYVDTSYVYNFNRPDAGGGRTNRGRVFDTNANGFTIQAMKLVLEKPTSEASPVGFRTDLMYGDDAELIHSGGLPTLNVASGESASTEAFDLQQAYVTYKAPVGAGLDLKAGKFITLLGAEVINSPENWNFSRSYMFGYAIPFTHTGVLASYPVLGEWGSLTAGIVNGWDIVDENNSFKTMLGSLTLTPMKGVTLATNLITGAERASDNSNDRTVLDLVATWQPLEKLTLMANYDYGHEASAAHGALGTAGPDTTNWSGVALYAKYDVTDKWSLAGRWEAFNDPDDARTALTGPGGTSDILEGLKLQEYTLTSQWKLYEHLLARLEYRHDDSNERAFFHTGAGFKTTQDTISTEVVCHF